jgi:DeoR/GlpR family transcriptional regulator of sugar metabolism
MADHLTVVADHSKFERVAPAFIAPVSRITSLVTDSKIGTDTLDALKTAGVRTFVATPKEEA